MEQKPRKIPERQCLGCNAHRPKSELLRVVRSPEGEVSLDLSASGKKSGRGAYICRDIKCLRRARKNGRLGTCLSCVIPDEVFDQMEKELLDYVGEN